MSWREVAHVLAAGGESSLGEVALRKRFDRLKHKLEEAARVEGLIE